MQSTARVTKSLREDTFVPFDVPMKDVEKAEKQDAARFVTRELGGFLPSVEEMKRLANPEYAESLAGIVARIKEMKDTYSNIITKLIRYYIQNISDEALDRYGQVDDLKYFNERDPSVPTDDQFWGQHYYDSLEAFFKQEEREKLAELYRELGEVQLEYQQGLIDLCRKRDEARLRTFPRSAEEFESIESKEAKILFARYLQADGTRRAQTSLKYGWKWEQTKPLIDAYETNKQFQTMIATFVNNNNRAEGAVGPSSRDPRVRR